MRLQRDRRYLHFEYFLWNKSTLASNLSSQIIMCLYLQGIYAAYLLVSSCVHVWLNERKEHFLFKEDFHTYKMCRDNCSCFLNVSLIIYIFLTVWKEKAIFINIYNICINMGPCDITVCSSCMSLLTVSYIVTQLYALHVCKLWLTYTDSTVWSFHVHKSCKYLENFI